jgi:hypothetical protein
MYFLIIIIIIKICYISDIINMYIYIHTRWSLPLYNPSVMWRITKVFLKLVFIWLFYGEYVTYLNLMEGKFSSSTNRDFIIMFFKLNIDLFQNTRVLFKSDHRRNKGRRNLQSECTSNYSLSLMTRVNGKADIVTLATLVRKISN